MSRFAQPAVVPDHYIAPWAGIPFRIALSLFERIAAALVVLSCFVGADLTGTMTNRDDAGAKEGEIFFRWLETEADEPVSHAAEFFSEKS